MGLPALSPTMETGILAEWYVQEGSSFSAGQAIAKIETDKASIDFEAQDDGYVAKILMEAGSGNDIACGTPIMVTVEEEDHVPAFATFQLPSTTTTAVVVEEATSAPAAAAVPPPVVAAAAPPTPAPAVVAAVAPPSPPAPAPATAVAPSASLHEAMVKAVAPVLSTGWGEFAKFNSPLIKTLSQSQKEYVEKYGTTGQLPL